MAGRSHREERGVALAAVDGLDGLVVVLEVVQPLVDLALELGQRSVVVDVGPAQATNSRTVRSA